MPFNQLKPLLQLTKQVQKEDPLYPPAMGNKIHDSTTVWKHFTWGVFLDNNKINAEVSYIRNTLWNAKLLDIDQIYNNSRHEWENRAQKFIKSKASSLVGRKHASLEGILRNVSDYALTLKEAADFFKKYKISLNYLKNATKDYNAAKTFLGELTFSPQFRPNPKKIQGIGLTKAVLWLHACGLGQDFCPPSRQVTDFVDYDINNLNYFQAKKQQNIDWDYVLAMQTFHEKEIRPSLQSATVRDTGVAVWYWKSGQGLLKRNKSKLNLQRFLDYLHSRNFKLGNFAGQLDDIDQVDDLSKDLGTFLT